VKTAAVGDFGSYAGKINSLYSIGEMQDYPKGGGIGLLKSKVEEILGLKIHYNARIDFDGFRKGVDTLGGIDITVDNTFDDYEYPREGFEDATCKDGTYNCQVEHIHFDKGPTHLNGTMALKFARSRKGTGVEGSDFARARRQQKVLVAAKEKALKIENLFDPGKISNLFKQFGQSIETDIDVSALTALYNLSKDVKTDTINSLVLDNSNYLYVPAPEEYGGAYALLPKGNSWVKIQAAVQDLFNQIPADSTTPAQ
jgi:LCP family protein required for cell wall assembly